MVLVILGGLQFEAEKFETRTMPTPDLKGKEMIYWIKVSTSDKRLITELRRFLEGSAKNIDLRVPGAFVWAKTELENYRAFNQKKADVMTSSSNPLEGQQLENGLTIEILLRRTISDSPKSQSPYG